MGIYVNNVRKSSGVKAVFADREVTVHACTYTCRYNDLPAVRSSWDRKGAFPYDAFMGRLEKIWMGARPEFVVIPADDKIQEGDRVYQWEGGLEWIDSDKIPGKCVGILRKAGRKWAVETLDEVKARGEKLLAVLRNGPWPKTLWASTLECSERFAEGVVDVLCKERLVKQTQDLYTGEGPKPAWHGQFLATLGPAAIDRFEKVLA